ncbi:hypothetical protein [Paenibacillus marinisediminis]
MEINGTNNKRSILQGLLLCLILCSLIISGCTQSDEKVVRETLDSYLENVKQKKPVQAYELLNKTSLPDQEKFTKSVQDHNLSKYEILETKEVDSNTYKVLTQLVVDDQSAEMVFILSKHDNKWSILLNTDTTKDNITF